MDAVVILMSKELTVLIVKGAIVTLNKGSCVHYPVLNCSVGSFSPSLSAFVALALYVRTIPQQFCPIWWFGCHFCVLLNRRLGDTLHTKRWWQNMAGSTNVCWLLWKYSPPNRSCHIRHYQTLITFWVEPPEQNIKNATWWFGAFFHFSVSKKTRGWISPFKDYWNYMYRAKQRSRFTL